MVRLPRHLFGFRRTFREKTFFDSEYYREQYDDVARSGSDLFRHYMDHGWREGRNPSANFITLFYRDKHLGGAPVNPLTHYLAAGQQAGLDTKPVDEDAYLDVQVPVVLPLFDTSGRFAEIDAASAEALRHYLRRGWRDSSPFRTEETEADYIDQVSFVDQLAVSPLYHYASQERFKGLVDAAAGWLGPSRTAAARAAQLSARQRRLLRSELADDFDAEFYLSRYADVRAAGIDPFDHFLVDGWREGRWPHPLFDSAYYLREHPELRDTGVIPLHHYVTKGRQAGLRPNPIGRRLYPRMTAPDDAEWSRVAPAGDLDRARCVVIMPAYRGYDETLAAIFAVLAAVQKTPFALHVVDDRSPDTALSAKLAALAARGLFSLAVNGENLGFVKSCNGALRRFADRTVILLNTDAKVSNDWLDRMLSHVERDPTIATVTPFSNNATICSYPCLNENNAIEPEVDAAALDAFASEANAGRSSDIPTGVGFCFLMSAKARAAVGVFDEDAFGRGYGEENDFCLRAAKAGFRNILAEDVFVYHIGEVSFGRAGDADPPGQKALIAKHPDYPELIRQHLRADQTEGGRFRLDLRRLAASLRPGPAVLVAHALAGGIVTHLDQEVARLAAQAQDVILLRLGVKGRWNVEITSKADVVPYLPNLREMPFGQCRDHLVDFLSWLAPAFIHVHSFVGLDWHATVGFMAMVRDSGVPYRFTLHDYSVVCHRNNLVLTDNRYCGLAAAERCRSCVATDPSYPEAVDPDVLRATYAQFLAGAEKVLAPSRDIADRLHRAGARYAIDVEPHEDEAMDAPLIVAADAAAPVTVVTIGAIGAHKGSRIILSLARDAKARELPIRYHIIGYSDVTNDLAAAGVQESGRFLKLDEALGAIAKVSPHLVFLPSIWPETWSYTLSMAFALGVPPVVFDIGAPADRIRMRGFGEVLPYASMMDIPALNDRMIALGRARAASADGSGAPP